MWPFKKSRPPRRGIIKLTTWDKTKPKDETVQTGAVEVEEIRDVGPDYTEVRLTSVSKIGQTCLVGDKFFSEE